MEDDLLKAIGFSDAEKASELAREKLGKGNQAWQLHLSLFPVVQRVLNPPFINPHLPKMYRIYRELVPYLNRNEIASLINLEISEYTKRSKLESLPKTPPLSFSIPFDDVESAIRNQDWEKTAVLLASFYKQQGGTALARRLLLLGSGYLEHSLGHSVSCTAFILLEMMERVDQDPWPALTCLADYFCKGRFQTTPPLKKSPVLFSEAEVADQLLRATSGRGIINLHHTITLYAIERVRQFFSNEEYAHLISAWIEFMGEKKVEPAPLNTCDGEPPDDYGRFYELFSNLEAQSLAAHGAAMIGSAQGRKRLGRFLLKGLCEQYQGNYNPHYLTGLGSTLWVLNHYWSKPLIGANALFQYVDFFFDGIRANN